jgi:putative DNA primase/helicase
MVDRMNGSKAREITLALGGDWYGTYGLVPGPGHSPKDRSVRIAASQSDPDEVHVHCFAPGDSWRDFKETLRSQGLIPALADRKVDCRDHAGIELRNTKARLRDAEDALRTANKVRRIVAESISINGTAADLYLHNRGLEPPFPRDLRYHPNLWTMGRDGKPICSAAMVALVRQAPGGEICAVHRTFLTAIGSKNPNVEKVKRMRGPYKGGALWPDQFADNLAIAEGIESALSYQQTFGLPTAAALSATNLAHLTVPNSVTRLLIAADRDAHGRGLEAAKDAARRLWRPGLHVRVQLPVGHKDFNDAMRAGSRR